MRPIVRRLISLLMVFVLLVGTMPQAFAASPGSETPYTNTSTDPPETIESTGPSDTAGPVDTTVPEDTPPEKDTEAGGQIPSEPTEPKDEKLTTPETRATQHGSHLQACLIWLEYDKTLSYTFEGVSNTVSSVALHRLYNNNTGNWETAYCIEPGVSTANSGYTDKLQSAEALWGNLTSAQQYAVGLAILYGAPNNPDLQTSDTLRRLSYELATYIIVQEISLGWRNATAPYDCTNSNYIDAFGSGELLVTSSFYPEVNNSYLRTSEKTYGQYDEVKYAYDLISSLMARHNIIPSFTSRFANQAPTHPLTQSGNKWTTTLTDTNNILSEYNFSNTDDLTFSVSGNKLTVTATGKGPYKAITPTRTVPNLTSGGSLFRIWKTAGGAEQELVTLGKAVNDPVPAYFNLGESTGAIKGTKTTETGSDKGNITMQLIRDGEVFATTTTDENGNFSFAEVPAGTYELHEVISSSSKYYCVENDQTVTVTAGDTSSVTVHNKLKRGNISGTKTTEDGKELLGWCMQLMSGETVIATTYTDKNGNFSFTDIPIGTYTVHEVEKDYYTYYCVNNDQTVTVKEGETASVSFTNNLKRGNISGTKTTEDGRELLGWCMQLMSGDTVIATTYTDKNGNFSFTDIPVGTYTVHEVEKDYYTYYCVENDQTVTVKAGETAAVSFTNNLKRGNIRGTKITEDGKELLGWCVKLMSGDTVIATTYTDKNGNFSFTNIPVGTYTVHEVEKDYYTYYCVENDQTVTVTYNDTTEVTIKNNLKRGDISGIKTTDTGTDKEGWTIQLLRDGEVFATTTTDENGAFAFKNIPIGTYTVHEAVPEGSAYQATTNDVSVTVSFNDTVEAEIKNTLIRGNVRLIKLDSDKLTRLSGAVFQITDARGQVHTMEEISAGEYYASGIAFGKAVIKEITPPAGFVLNEKEYTVNIEEDGKTYDLTDTGYEGIPNAPIPGFGTADKVAANGIPAEGYAMTIWTDRTGPVDPVTYYLRSDDAGGFFLTDDTFSIPSGTKNYTISGLYDGDYKISEYFSSSDYQAACTQSIQVTVKDSTGKVTFDQSYSKKDLTVSTVNGVENYTTPVFTVTGLNGGGSMTVTVTNNAIPGSVEIKKTSTDGDYLDGYAFKMEYSNADTEHEISYWRSDENGNFYLTDSNYAEVPGSKTYVLNSIYDGTYTIRELIGSSTWQYSRMDSVRFTVTDKDGIVTLDTTVSGTDITQEDTDFILSQPISISGLNGGGKLTIEVNNTPLPAQITIDKVNHGDEPLAGARFMLEWSKDGTDWTPVTLNSEETITIGGCQSPNLDGEGCLVSDSNGKIVFSGLHPMLQYRLIEVEAPNGYVLLAEPIQVGTLFDDFQEHFRVVNGTVYSLPNTGWTGSSSIVICGAVGAALAILILMFTLCATPPRRSVKIEKKY